MLDDGDMVAEVIVGAELKTVTLVELLAIKPEESVAVARQSIVEPTFTSLDETV